MIYRVLQCLFTCFFKLRFSFGVRETEKLDFQGPLLVAANHRTNWDPFLIHCAIPAHMAFMAKEELFKIPVLGWVMRHEKAISVRRGASDRQAIREALGALAEKRILGIFPEGTRSKTGELKKFQPGMTMLAVKSQSPVLPVWIDWNSEGKVKIWLGTPLVPPSLDSDREEQNSFTESVRDAILKLSEKALEP